MFRSKQCAETSLLDGELMRRSLQFYSSVCALLSQQLEAAQTGGPPACLAFRATPEWYVEDIAEFMLFAVQYVTFLYLSSISMIYNLLICIHSYSIYRDHSISHTGSKSQKKTPIPKFFLLITVNIRNQLTQRY